MTGEDPYLVWMANKLWEDHGIDQRMTKAMERHANILWVDPPVSIATSAGRRFGAPRTVRPTLSVLSRRVTRLRTTAMPGLTRFGVRTTTAPLMRAQVRWALRQTGIKPLAVVATYLEDVLGGWGKEVLSVLHGTDDYVAGAELMGLSVRRLRAQEKSAVAKADVVTALSLPLAERWSALRGAPVLLIPNGCTPVKPSTQTLSAAISHLTRPVVALVGRLNERIDMSLVEAVALAGFSLLIVGPHNSRWEPRRFAALTARPVVHYVGLVPEHEAPGYIAAADIGITPYADSAFNRGSFPLKTLDYLSVGRPTVSTPLPAARWLLDDLNRSNQAAFSGQLLALAEGPADFINAIRAMVGNPGQPLASRRGGTESATADRCRAFAARHTWEKRADTLATAIGLLPNADHRGAA